MLFIYLFSLDTCSDQYLIDRAWWQVDMQEAYEVVAIFTWITGTASGHGGKYS